MKKILLILLVYCSLYAPSRPRPTYIPCVRPQKSNPNFKPCNDYFVDDPLCINQEKYKEYKQQQALPIHNQQSLFAYHVGMLINYIFAIGYTCSLGEAYRTPEQAALYAKEDKGIKHSQHTKRLAIDIDLFKDGKYLMENHEYAHIGAYWKSLDPKNRWGGDFKRGDGNHFERINE